MKNCNVGDLVKIRPHVQPPELYGVGVVTHKIYDYESKWHGRVVVHWEKARTRGDVHVQCLELLSADK